jgi:hypothetical protein
MQPLERRSGAHPLARRANIAAAAVPGIVSASAWRAEGAVALRRTHQLCPNCQIAMSCRRTRRPRRRSAHSVRRRLLRFWQWRHRASGSMLRPWRPTGFTGGVSPHCKGAARHQALVLASTLMTHATRPAWWMLPGPTSIRVEGSSRCHDTAWRPSTRTWRCAHHGSFGEGGGGARAGGGRQSLRTRPSPGAVRAELTA